MMGPRGGLTPREFAAGQYRDALGAPTRVLGRHGADVYADRQRMIEEALAACTAAIGTPRILPREWDDARLRTAIDHLQRVL